MSRRKWLPTSELTLSLLKLLIIVAALAGVAAAYYFLDFGIASSASVVSVIVMAIWAGLEFIYASLGDTEEIVESIPPLGHRLFHSLYRGVRLGVLFLLAITIAYGWLTLVRIQTAAIVHTQPAVRHRVLVWLLRVNFALAAALTLLILASAYAWWKFRSTRFAESRLGAQKDTLIALQDLRTKHTWEEAVTQAQNLLTRHLSVALTLSSWDWLIGRVAQLLRKRPCTRVELLEVPAGGSGFRTVCAFYPDNLPNRALEAHQWLDVNLQLAGFNETEFKKLVDMAKGRRPRGWQKRLLNMPERCRLTSAAGWAAATGKVLNSNDADSCIYFDDSYRQALSQLKLSRACFKWLEIRSFVACPIIWNDDRPVQVLFASKNIRYGFVPEDVELVIAVAQLFRLTTGRRRGNAA
ncbi:MAG TPA: GAF domain-containing protein [Thermoanaerobaculia bacterium]|nr:GAF domain-containing protein [Thermoanaerobaculia bacterium]